MEPKLSKQAQAIVDELHKAGHLLKPESVKRLEQALVVSESWWLVVGWVRRFVVGLAAFLVALSAATSYWPFGGK